MTSLTKTSIITRKIIRYSIFAVIFIISARMVILTGIRVYRHFNPVPPPPPTVGFGKLPSLPFPKKEVPENLNLILETPDGELPTFPEQIKVYFMPKLSSGLLSLDSAKEKAVKLGFSSKGTQESETIYTFPHNKVPAKLRINTATGVFSISYDLAGDPTPLEKRPPAPEVAASQINSFLGSSGLLPTDLSGPTEVEYIKVDEGKIIQALSLSDANLVKINFFRKAYEEYPSLTPNPGKGNVWFMVSGSTQKEKNIVTGEYHYFPVDEDSYETYLLKTSQAAWEELKAGGGYIAQNSSIKDAVTKVRRVYLAYYDAGVSAEFYQPIIVFEGDGGFMAYIPAITPDYYGD